MDFTCVFQPVLKALECVRQMVEAEVSCRSVDGPPPPPIAGRRRRQGRRSEEENSRLIRPILTNKVLRAKYGECECLECQRLQSKLEVSRVSASVANGEKLL